jgi:hypothetical protein
MPLISICNQQELILLGLEGIDRNLCEVKHVHFVRNSIFLGWQRKKQMSIHEEAANN